MSPWQGILNSAAADPAAAPRPRRQFNRCANPACNVPIKRHNGKLYCIPCAAEVAAAAKRAWQRERAARRKAEATIL